MTKQELEQLPVWKQLGPGAPLRFYSMELCTASREHYPSAQNPDREAVILRNSPLGLCVDFNCRQGLERQAAYYHATADSLIICRKNGRDYHPNAAVARDGCIVLM